jgi:transcriptional regulator with XRE-family HTH domain
MDGMKLDSRILGNRVAEMRLSRGLTQFQLAEMIGRSRVYIGYLEQGKRCGTLLTYLDIVSALGYSLNDLVGGFPDPNTELFSELNIALTECSGDEKESILRIFREMLKMIRMYHGG